MRAGPSRRTSAALLGALVLVVLLGVPAATGHTVAGRGMPAVQLSPRPQPGQCIAPLQTPSQLNTVVDVVPIVPCTAPHSAELLTVRTLDPADWPERPDVADARFTNGELSLACNELAGRYLGWGTKNALHRVSVSFFTRLTVSSELQWSAGQRWYACELMPGVLDFPLTWTGTARNANNGTPPDVFATCAGQPAELRVSCNRPHSAEQLTQTYGGQPMTAHDCALLAGRVIGTPDPTFGNQLTVIARRVNSGTACWVTTTSKRSLTGTLINHGAAPLPLR
jgi:hypothetical protein